MVQCLEFLRLRIREINPEVPDCVQALLIAGGTAHNEGLRPLLALRDGCSENRKEWDCMLVLERTQSWLDNQNPAELEKLISETSAPTFLQLCSKDGP
jgi:hypothetical protein